MRRASSSWRRRASSSALRLAAASSSVRRRAASSAARREFSSARKRASSSALRAEPSARRRTAFSSSVSGLSTIGRRPDRLASARRVGSTRGRAHRCGRGRRCARRHWRPRRRWRVMPAGPRGRRGHARAGPGRGAAALPGAAAGGAAGRLGPVDHRRGRRLDRHDAPPAVEPARNVPRRAVPGAPARPEVGTAPARLGRPAVTGGDRMQGRRARRRSRRACLARPGRRGGGRRVAKRLGAQASRVFFTSTATALLRPWLKLCRTMPVSTVFFSSSRPPPDGRDRPIRAVRSWPFSSLMDGLCLHLSALLTACPAGMRNSRKPCSRPSSSSSWRARPRSARPDMDRPRRGRRHPPARCG